MSEGLDRILISVEGLVHFSYQFPVVVDFSLSVGFIFLELVRSNHVEHADFCSCGQRFNLVPVYRINSHIRPWSFT